MEFLDDKKNLLLDMIAFAQVDGKLHDKEYLFLSLIANSLNISDTVFKSLFHIEQKFTKPKTEMERYVQFYKLALLMHCDGEKHLKEIEQLGEITIFMGLNPFATKRILKLMEEAPRKTINPEIIAKIIKEQHN